MRTFLVLLILANLGLLAWQQGWIPSGEPEPEEEAGPAPFEQASRSLLLLSELPQEQLDAMATLAQARLARTNAVQELAAVQDQVATVQDQIGEVEAEIAENREQSTQVQGAMLDALDAAVAEAEPEPAPEPAAALVPWCAEAGVFGDQASAEAYATALSELGASGRVVEREEPVSSTWWVHMPAFSSETAATTMRDELQAKNIDSYYMRSGEMAGGISLGVYSRRESALIGQQRLADQGYATSIREVFRMGSRFYVAVALPDATLREAPEWADFLASAGGVEVAENACEMIAPENQFP